MMAYHDPINVLLSNENANFTLPSSDFEIPGLYSPQLSGKSFTIEFWAYQETATNYTTWYSHGYISQSGNILLQ